MLLLTLLVLAGVDGGVVPTGLDPKDPIYASCPDAPVTEKVDEVSAAAIGAALARGQLNGYSLLHPRRAERLACFIEACDSDRKSQHAIIDQPTGPGWWVALMSLFSIGMLAGAALSWSLERLF